MNISKFPDNVQDALDRICDGEIPDNLHVQKYVYEDYYEGSNIAWIFSADTVASDLGYAVLPAARERQVLDRLREIEEVESLKLYKKWLEQTADEIERNWNEQNTIHLEDI